MKTVTLTVTNGAGSNTLTRTGWIYVSENWADFYGPAMLNVDDQHAWFRTINPEDNYAKFAVSSANGYDNTKCFKLNNYKDVSGAGLATDDFFYYDRLVANKDFLITPSFDLRHTTNVDVSFKFAYATNATDVNDVTEELKAFYSKDCGQTWLPVILSVEGIPAGQAITGANLISGGYAGYADYAPSSNQDWRTANFTYAASSTDENIRFMFKFEASSMASNLYIDDIFVDGTLGLITDEIALLDVNVYPNPTSNGEALTVTFNAQDNPVEFILKDAQGKVVATDVVNKTNTQVTHTIEGTDNLNAACYFLEVISGDHKTTRKVVVL